MKKVLFALLLQLILWSPSYTTSLSSSQSIKTNINYEYKTPSKTYTSDMREYADSYYLSKIPSDYRMLVFSLSKKYNIPMSIVYGLGMRESEWKSSCKDNINKNGSHDIGLFQLNSYYVSEYEWKFFDGYPKEKFNPRNPKHNIQVAMKYLRSLYIQFDGVWTYALIAYNRGATAVIERKISIRDKNIKEYINEIYSYRVSYDPFTY